MKKMRNKYIDYAQTDEADAAWLAAGHNAVSADARNIMLKNMIKRECKEMKECPDASQ